MNGNRLTSVIGLLVAATSLASMANSAAAKDAKVPSWKDEHAHGFVGCLAQEVASPHYFDLKDAKSDEGADVGTLRLTGHFLGIDDPKDSLNKRVHVTGVYLGPERDNPSGSTILLTDDARVEEGQCP
jgi:hypothetical protein